MAIDKRVFDERQALLEAARSCTAAGCGDRRRHELRTR
jgi:hypothetical protein